MAKTSKKKPPRRSLRVSMMCGIGGGYTVNVVLVTGRPVRYFATIIHKRNRRPIFQTELYLRERTAEQQVWKLLAGLRHIPPVLTVHRTHDTQVARSVYLTSGLPKLVYAGRLKAPVQQ